MTERARGCTAAAGTTKVLLFYIAATVSLCALEVLANSQKLPVNMISITVEIPESISIPAYTEADLPADWSVPVPPSLTKDLGTTWAKLKTSLAISVPSAVVPDERNYLINPLHQDFGLIQFSRPKPFVFDPRLK